MAPGPVTQRPRTQFVPPRRSRGGAGGWSLRRGVVCASQLRQKVVRLLRSGGVLLHHLAEERRDVLLAGVLGVAHVLAVIVPGLQRVVLHRDEIEGDVVESSLSCWHVGLLSV